MTTTGMSFAPSAPTRDVPGYLRRLPLVTLYLTERCNSRCAACDYWRNGSGDVSAESVAGLVPALAGLGTRVVLVSGGEPLLHREWPRIASILRRGGLRLWLLTSGLSLAKQATRVAEFFDSVTVSLDGTDRGMYGTTRGLDAFDKVCEGIRATVRTGVPVSLRVTVQRANYLALPGFVVLAHELGVRQISFLAADVRNAHAFGRTDGFVSDVALRPADLPRFSATLTALEANHRADFESGFIEESPAKLRRLLDYFSAVCGQGAYPRVRCNAPEISAVIDAAGRVAPCFFIPGPLPPTAPRHLTGTLNSAPMIELRRDIRAGRRPECATCVCSLWRDPDHATEQVRPMSRAPTAVQHAGRGE